MTNEEKFKIFKVGTLITIKKRPIEWDSTYNDKYPLTSVTFPYQCTIKKIGLNILGEVAFTDGKYGWSLNNKNLKYVSLVKIIRKQKIEKLKDKINERKNIKEG